jgi:hypothetical protein
MEWQKVSANWPAFAEAILQRWPRTAEEDVLAVDGERDAFEAYIARTNDLTRAEAAEQVEDWLNGAIPADVAMAEEADDANITASGQHIPAGEDVYSEDADFGDERVPERPIGRSDEG